MSSGYLLDTCAFFDAALAPQTLSAQAEQILRDTQTARFLPSVVVWEISVKQEKGKLDVGSAPLLFVRRGLAALRLTLADVELENMAATAEVSRSVPSLKNSFDHLVVAMARRRKLTVLSSDATFGRYDVSWIDTRKYRARDSLVTAYFATTPACL